MASTLEFASQADLSLAQLLRLALKSIAIQHDGQSQVWLTEEPERLYPRLEALHRELGPTLPALGNAHFLRRGEHPYSRDVSMALEILQQSGAITRENPNYVRFSPRVFSDTQETVESEVERVFPPGTPDREAFDAFVDGLRELVTE